MSNELKGRERDGNSGMPKVMILHIVLRYK